MGHQIKGNGVAADLGQIFRADDGTDGCAGEGGMLAHHADVPAHDLHPAALAGKAAVFLQLEALGVADQPVWVGIRPEGFVLEETGPLCCSLQGVEVMGRDITVVAGHAACENTAIRAIISAENAVNAASGTVSFALKPNKVFLFSRETEGRLL